MTAQYKVLLRGGYRQLGVASGLGVEPLIQSRIRLSGLELTVDAEQRHQVLRAAVLELEDVGFVVADVAEQLVPDRHFAIEPPASQCLETDLPAVGNVLAVITG